MGVKVEECLHRLDQMSAVRITSTPHADTPPHDDDALSRATTRLVLEDVDNEEEEDDDEPPWESFGFTPQKTPQRAAPATDDSCIDIEPDAPPPPTLESAIDRVLSDPDLLECIFSALLPRGLLRCALLSKHYCDTCMSEERWQELRRAQRLRQVPFDPMTSSPWPRMCQQGLKPEGYNKRWAWEYRCAESQETFHMKLLVWIVGRPTKEWPNGTPDWPAVTQSTHFNPSLGTGRFVPAGNEDYEASRKMLAVRVVSCPELSDCIRTLPQRLVGWEAGLAFWRSHDGKPFPSTRVFLESEGRAMARTAAVEECLAALAQGELPGEAKPWF